MRTHPTVNRHASAAKFLIPCYYHHITLLIKTLLCPSTVANMSLYICKPLAEHSPTDTFFSMYTPNFYRAFAFLLSASLSSNERVSWTVRSDTDTVRKVTK